MFYMESEYCGKLSKWLQILIQNPLDQMFFQIHNLLDFKKGNKGKYNGYNKTSPWSLEIPIKSNLLIFQSHEVAQIENNHASVQVLLRNYGIKFRKISQLSFRVLRIRECELLISLTKLIPWHYDLCRSALVPDLH